MNKSLPAHPIVLSSYRKSHWLEETAESHNNWFKQGSFVNPENEDIPVGILAGLYPEVATLGPEYRTIIKAFDIIRKLDGHLKMVSQPKTTEAGKAFEEYLDNIVKRVKLFRFWGMFRDAEKFFLRNLESTFLAFPNKRVQQVMGESLKKGEAVYAAATAIHLYNGSRKESHSSKTKEEVQIILEEWLKLEQALLTEGVINETDLTGIRLDS